MRLAPSLLALGVLVFGCAASPAGRRRHAPDVSAMREAIASAKSQEHLASPAAYAHFLDARLAHLAGDHRRAADELRLALATDDGNPFLLTALAEEYARLADLTRAELELKKVLEHQADYQPAQLLMGKVLLEDHRFVKARFHLRQAVRLAPRDPEAYLALAQLSLEQKAPDDAIRVVEELAQALPGEPTGYKRLGLAFLDRNDLPRAQVMLERASERDPGDFETWVLLAQIYQASGRAERAEDAYDQALERDPDNREVLLSAGKLALEAGSAGSDVRARAYFDRLLLLSDEPEWTLKVAYAYLSARRMAEATEVLEAARKAAPHPKLSFSGGLVLERMRRFVQAADAYAEVPRDSELHDEARLRRAMCLSQAGQHARALALFEEGRKDRPDYLALYAPYAQALERAGRASDALLLLERVAKERPTPEVLEALASVYERQGRGDEAVRIVERAVADKPKDEELLYVLGSVYERRGELDKAIEQMRAVLAINPKNAAALNFIGYTLADRNERLDEAEQMLTRALILQPDSGAFLDSMGWLEYRRGDFAHAVSHLERAAERLPEDPLVREHLGDAYRGAGKKEKAVEAYKRALEELGPQESPGREAVAQRESLLRKLKLLGSEAPDR